MQNGGSCAAASRAQSRSMYGKRRRTALGTRSCPGSRARATWGTMSPRERISPDDVATGPVSGRRRFKLLYRYKCPPYVDSRSRHLSRGGRLAVCGDHQRPSERDRPCHRIRAVGKRGHFFPRTETAVSLRIESLPLPARRSRLSKSPRRTGYRSTGRLARSRLYPEQHTCAGPGIEIADPWTAA
jgi:hypothetical protein